MNEKKSKPNKKSNYLRMTNNPMKTVFAQSTQI